MTGYKSKKAAAQDRLDSMEREALKLALDWAEKHGEVVLAGGGMPAVSAMNAWAKLSKAALAQPEQEPLTENGMYRLGYHNGYGFGEAYGKANPSPRPWVDLTDDEIEDLFQSAAGADEETHIRFARAIEQSLKEKNT